MLENARACTRTVAQQQQVVLSIEQKFGNKNHRESSNVSLKSFNAVMCPRARNALKIASLEGTAQVTTMDSVHNSS